jgi:predicted nuclease of restriction endonuclease-like (RecB) superfamily
MAMSKSKKVYKKHLSQDDIHAIMNQMEVFMAKNAEELADLIAEKQAKAESRAYDALKTKVVAATSKMLTDLSYSEEIELEDDDLMALGRVTEGLRELGYKFRFIEIQNTSGETLKHKLLVSVEHLK